MSECSFGHPFPYPKQKVIIREDENYSFNSVPFSLSKQPLTAFAILSYGKRDFAEAEGRKTEIGERYTRRRRGGGRGKNCTLDQNGVTWRRRPKTREGLHK